MAVENDEIDVPEEVKNSLEVTPKLAEAFPEAITLSEALNCRICRSHIKTPMLTKCILLVFAQIEFRVRNTLTLKKQWEKISFSLHKNFVKFKCVKF